MDERLRIILEAQDRAAAAFRQVASHTRTMNQNLRTVQTTAAQMSSGTRNSLAGLNTSLRASAGQAGTASRSITTSLNAISLSAGRAVSALRQLPSVIAQAAAAASRARGPLGGLAGFALNRAMPGIGLASGAAGLLGALGGGAAAVGFGQRGVDMNLTREGGLTAMTSLLGGNRGQAEAFFKELEAEAAKSIPTLKQLIPLSTQLIQAYGPQGLGKVLPTIRAFGDAAAIAAGGDTNRMELALLGFRQILNRGVAQQEELNQIGENLGVNVTDILKRQFGTADTEVLKAAGVTGAMVADAIVAGLNAKFGGAQAGMAQKIPGLASNIDDALNAIAGQATTGLTRSIETSLGNVLKALNATLGRGELVKSLGTIFGTVGKLLEFAAGHAEKFFGWIEKVANAQGLRMFLINTLALLQVLADRFLKFFGVDMAKFTDPKGVQRWFDAFGAGIANVIDTAFGLARVWNEVITMIKGFWADLSDTITDFAGDTVRTFSALFAGLQVTISGFQASLMGSFMTLADALNSFRIGNWQPFNIDVSGFREGQVRALSDQGDAAARVNAIVAKQGAAVEARRTREANKFAADPFRGHDPGRRILEAFQGIGRNRDAQDVFWGDFQTNRANIGSWLFGGAGAPQGVGGGGLPPGVPTAPQMFGGGGSRGSVSIVPQVQIPAYPGMVSPWGGTIQQGAGMASAAALGGAGVNVVNLNINSPGLAAILRADPAFAAALQEFISTYLLAQGQIAYPGPTMP